MKFDTFRQLLFSEEALAAALTHSRIVLKSHRIEWEQNLPPPLHHARKWGKQSFIGTIFLRTRTA